MFCLPKSQRARSNLEDDEIDEPLCSTCSALDLRAILHDGIPEKHPLPLGHLTDILNKRERCGLCRLIADVLTVNVRWLNSHPDIDFGGITCTLYTDESGVLLNKIKHVRSTLYFRTSEPRGTTETTVNDVPSALHILLLEEDASKVGRIKELHGRRVGQQLDVGLLKRWIRICRNKHGEKCETEWWRGAGEVLPPTVRVVDVARMAIVTAPPKCRYVTLSYVWGGPGDAYWTTQANLKQRSIPGGLDASTMPDTISDTIQLVRQLGERYLWIDALCIVQDDRQDKAVQIGVMELIYNISSFTIFAAGGTSVQDPLHGVRPGTRDPKQHIIKIQGLHFALMPLLTANSAVSSSTWNERGWTYQELMLSRRRVFFTTHQVYFECRENVCREDIVSNPTTVPYLASRWFTGMFQDVSTSVPVHQRHDSYLRFYMNIVENFTQRRLTVESDIEDAIAALLTALIKAFKLPGGEFGKTFKFGMPLGGLEGALLWQPMANAPHSRRAPAEEMKVPWPSWSWAAWRGAAKYAGSYVFVDMRHGRTSDSMAVNQSLVEQWYVVDDNNQPIRQHVEREGRIIHGDIELIQSVAYVGPKGDIDPQQLITENAPLLPGTLVFRTSYSRFNVTKADDVDSADAAANYAIYSILSDIPRPSTLVGRAILPCSTHSPTAHDFIVVSRAYDQYGLYDEERLGKRYSGCMLHVMVVQKMQDGRMERIGVGVIFEQAWSNSMPEEKIVYLG